MKNRTTRGQRRHLVTVQGPGAAIPDGDGGFTQTWSALTPATWYCSIEPATARDLERVAAGTIISTASHVLKGDYHPTMTPSARIVFGTRVFQITGVSDPEERHIESVVIAVELLDAPPVTDTSWVEAGWIE